MEIYKVGDKVIVKHINSRIDGPYYGACFVKNMEVFCGKIVTIKHVFYPKSLNPKDYRYYIKEDYDNWFWSPDMFDNDSTFINLIHIL